MENLTTPEKHNNFEKAYERAKQLCGILIKYSIKKAPNGKFSAKVCVLEARDDLTKNVFVVVENEKRVREVVSENGNVYYEDAEETANVIQFICKSFEEAKKKVEETIEKIVENRKKVRQTQIEEEAYVVF
jgi:hypothetical protein